MATRPKAAGERSWVATRCNTNFRDRPVLRGANGFLSPLGRSGVEAADGMLRGRMCVAAQDDTPGLRPWTIAVLAALAWALILLAFASLAPSSYVPRIFQNFHVEHFA